MIFALNFLIYNTARLKISESKDFRRVIRRSFFERQAYCNSNNGGLHFLVSCTELRHTALLSIFERFSNYLLNDFSKFMNRKRDMIFKRASCACQPVYLRCLLIINTRFTCLRIYVSYPPLIRAFRACAPTHLNLNKVGLLEGSFSWDGGVNLTPSTHAPLPHITPPIHISRRTYLI